MNARRTSTTRNLADGEVISLDGGRVRITLQKRSGRMSRVTLDLAPDVVIDRPESVVVTVAEAGPIRGRLVIRSTYVLPERCAILCFGARQRNRLFMAASHSLYALYVNTQGALGG